MPRRKPRPAHPTKQKLIDTALALLEDHQPYELTLEMVLQASGVSSGSLYHHFNDFPDLIDHALVATYAQLADLQIRGMQEALDASSNVHEYERNIHQLIALTAEAGSEQIRITRALIVAQGAGREEMREMLTVEQNRLTDALADIIGVAKARGWIQPDQDPRVLSTFVQAYSMGRIVDDLASSSLSNEQWVTFVQHMISASALNL